MHIFCICVCLLGAATSSRKDRARISWVQPNPTPRAPATPQAGREWFCPVHPPVLGAVGCGLWDGMWVVSPHPTPSHPIPSLVQVLGVNSRNRIVDRLARMQESRAPIGAGCDGIAGRDPISYGRGGMGREGLLASIEPLQPEEHGQITDHGSWITHRRRH